MPRNVTMCVQFCCWSGARINLLVVGNFILSYKVKVYMALKVMHLFALMHMWCVWNCIVSEYFFHLLIDALYMLIKILWVLSFTPHHVFIFFCSWFSTNWEEDYLYQFFAFLTTIMIYINLYQLLISTIFILFYRITTSWIFIV